MQNSFGDCQEPTGQTQAREHWLIMHLDTCPCSHTSADVHINLVVNYIKVVIDGFSIALASDCSHRDSARRAQLDC